LASLGAGLFKQYAAHKSNKSDRVTVTVERGEVKIERQAVMRPDEASKVLDMVQQPEAHPQVSTK
jgi:hypothetical protein